MNNTLINENVAVTSMGFKQNLTAYPRRIEYRGSAIEFIDAGLRCLIRKGSHVSEVMTMSDGHSLFRLRREGGSWTLLSITA